MTIIQVDNTSELPWGCSFRAVSAKDDGTALEQLSSIAARFGLKIQQVYKWGHGYYYGRIEG